MIIFKEIVLLEIKMSNAIKSIEDWYKKINRIGQIEHLRDIDDHTREERIDRYLEVNRSIAIPINDFTHHLIDAIKECINLYRDGHFIATIIMTQSVNEGLLKLVAERKSIRYKDKGYCYLFKILLDQKIFPEQCIDASKQIYGSYRNDFHHMNPKVSKIDFPSLAKKNIHNLFIFENEIFHGDINDGKIIPKHPEFWFIQLGTKH